MTNVGEFFIFLVVGGIAALTNFISRIVYNSWLTFSMSVILAYITGMFVAYFLFKYVVFKAARQNTKQSILYFILFNALGMLQAWGISVGLATYVFPLIHFNFHPKEVAHFIGILVPAFSSYLGHKYFTFKTA